MNVTPITCKVCGGTDSVLWHSFIHHPILRLAPEGILYRGTVFYLCDRCMAEMIDTSLSIRRAKDGMLMEKTELPDCITRDCSCAGCCNDPPDFHHSVIKPKEDTGDEM